MSRYYTHYPRTILWLVRGGALSVPAPESPDGVRLLEVPSFYIGKFPITNEQFEAALPGFVRSQVSAADRDPATGVDFDRALAFCGWYSEVSRKPMRLPSALEWEYACRAGAATRYYRGNEPEAAAEAQWDAENSGGVMQPLDEKRSNDFGLYGMLGGVWEWTSTRADAAGGSESSEDRRRLLMGGSILTARAKIDCSLRRPEAPEADNQDFGFRIVRNFR